MRVSHTRRLVMSGTLYLGGTIPVIVIMVTWETVLALFAQSILSGDASLMVGQT